METTGIVSGGVPDVLLKVGMRIFKVGFSLVGNGGSE